MTQQVPKRADQLVVGDRIPDEHLAFRFNQGPAQVVFVAYEDTVPLKWAFVAYRYPNGQHDSMTVLPEAVLQVYPAAPVGHDYSRADDPETTQPIAGRMPAHCGGMTDCGLVEEDDGCPRAADGTIRHLLECAEDREVAELDAWVSQPHEAD
jgi:hypothetical protein